MFPVPSSSTWSPEPWTLSDPAPSGRFSARTTLFSDSPEPETTGLKVNYKSLRKQ